MLCSGVSMIVNFDCALKHFDLDQTIRAGYECHRHVTGLRQMFSAKFNHVEEGKRGCDQEHKCYNRVQLIQNTAYGLNISYNSVLTPKRE